MEESSTVQPSGSWWGFAEKQRQSTPEPGQWLERLHPADLELENTEFWKAFRCGWHLDRATGPFDRNRLDHSVL